MDIKEQILHYIKREIEYLEIERIKIESKIEALRNVNNKIETVKLEK